MSVPVTAQVLEAVRILFAGSSAFKLILKVYRSVLKVISPFLTRKYIIRPMVIAPLAKAANQFNVLRFIFLKY
jgi:hypothetical protein